MNFSYIPEMATFFLLPGIAATVFLLAMIGSELKPAHLFAFVIFVFVLNGILTVAVHYLDREQAMAAVTMVVLGCAIIFAMSNITMPLLVRGWPWFEFLLVALFFGTAAIISVEALRNGLRLVAFAQIYEFRGEVDLSAPGRYAHSLYVFAIGPAVIAVGLWRRNYMLAAAAIGLFVVGYMLTFQKIVLLAPVWVVGMWYFSGLRMARTPVGIFCFLIGPLVVTGLYLQLGLPNSREVLGTIPVRMYAVPGQVFAHYLDFFSRNPHTWFSHISGVNLFVEYPFAEQLPTMIGNTYPGGNQNANFWAQDAIAGGGIWTIPVVSFVFGLVLVLVNSAAKGLDIRFVLTMCTMTAQRFADGTLATGMLTGGLGLILVFLVLAPRDVYGYERETARIPGERGLIPA